MLTFTIAAAAPGAELLYAYGTFTLLGLLYSMIYVPYNALPLMTAQQRGRVQFRNIVRSSPQWEPTPL